MSQSAGSEGLVAFHFFLSWSEHLLVAKARLTPNSATAAFTTIVSATVISISHPLATVAFVTDLSGSDASTLFAFARATCTTVAPPSEPASCAG
jgi:hypothetical protein